MCNINKFYIMLMDYIYVLFTDLRTTATFSFYIISSFVFL
jgi:hypothetical protein